jgi:hypothetical protein
LLALVQNFVNKSRTESKRHSLADYSLCLVGLTFVGYLCWSHVEEVRYCCDRIDDANNLHALAIAMHDFEKEHGHLPPAAIFSADGKPLLSWRVLLLPHLEHGDLFKRFRLDEPWDSAHNIELLKEMPRLFGYPHDEATYNNYTTRYRVFVGPGAAFEGKSGIPLADFTDGTEQTILVVRTVDAVPWTEPDELIYDPNGPLPGLYYHQGTTQAVFVNGHVHVFDEMVSKPTLRALITRKAGDKPGNDW